MGGQTRVTKALNDYHTMHEASRNNEVVKHPVAARGALREAQHPINQLKPPGLDQEVRRHVEVTRANPQALNARQHICRSLQEVQVPGREALSIVGVDGGQVRTAAAQPLPMSHDKTVLRVLRQRGLHAARQSGMSGNTNTNARRGAASRSGKRRLQGKPPATVRNGILRRGAGVDGGKVMFLDEQSVRRHGAQKVVAGIPRRKVGGSDGPEPKPRVLFIVEGDDGGPRVRMRVTGEPGNTGSGHPGPRDRRNRPGQLGHGGGHTARRRLRHKQVQRDLHLAGRAAHLHGPGTIFVRIITQAVSTHLETGTLPRANELLSGDEGRRGR